MAGTLLARVSHAADVDAMSSPELQRLAQETRSEVEVRLSRLRIDTPSNVAASLRAVAAMFEIGLLDVKMALVTPTKFSIVAEEKK
jgi:hypothetical protein